MLETEKILAKQRFTEFLEAKKLRKTSERFKILEAIYSQSTFFDAKKIKKLLKKYPVSLATIYNTLELLLQCNLIIRHTFDLRKVKYEKTPFGEGNYYRICMQCGSYKEFTDLKLKKSISLRKFSTFKTEHHSLYLYGICKKCEQKKQEKII